MPIIGKRDLVRMPSLDSEAYKPNKLDIKKVKSGLAAGRAGENCEKKGVVIHSIFGCEFDWSGRGKSQSGIIDEQPLIQACLGDKRQSGSANRPDYH